MKKYRLTGLLAAALLLAALAAPNAAAVQAMPAQQALTEQPVCPAIDDEGGWNPNIIETGTDNPKYDIWRNEFRRYDIFFDKLVAEGAISAEQEGVIKSAIENAVKEARQQGNWKIDMSTILSMLESEGKLTSEQKTAVESALRAERLQSAIRRMTGSLDRLVSSGTITAAQEKKILSAVEEAVKSDLRPDVNALLQSLERSGAISAGQKAAIEKALEPPHPGKTRPKSGGRHTENPA